MSILERISRRWSDLITGNSSSATAAQPPATKQKAVQPNVTAAPAAPAADPWPLTRTLLHFYAADTRTKHGLMPEAFSLREANEGIFVTGSPGSGKSSGSGRHLAAALLRAGAGGLVLTAKPEETDTWRQYARENGRETDLIVFGEKPEGGFNFLDYEMANAKGNPAEAATNVLIEIAEIVGGKMGEGDSKIWINSAKEMIQSALNACLLAGESASVAQIFKLANSDKVADAILAKAQARADAGELTASQVRDLEATQEYLGVQWRNMDERPKSSVLMTASTMANTFRFGAMRDLFTANTTVTPDAILAGKIIVVGQSVMQYAEAGKAANVLWKYCLQKAVLRRNGLKDTDRPTFIFADECQFFVTRGDADFVTSSRSFRCVNVYLTQNRPNLLARMNEATTDGFLGCFGTKIFHANNDPKTNEWAADSIAKTLQTRTSTSTSYNVGGARGGPGGGGGTNQQQVLDHELPPRHFMTLAKGGPPGLTVTAILFRSGHVFRSSGTIYTEVGFKQNEVRL